MKKIIDINFKQLENDAKSIRRKIIEIAYVSGGGQHLGGGLSMVEIMSYVYSQLIDVKEVKLKSQKRVRFILSKGHGVLGFYPVLNFYGLISDKILSTYKQELSELISHPIKNLDYGIESSNGSLGHGLSYGVGISHGLKIKGIDSKVIVLVGDGECNEGSIWEAAMSASSLNLDNLICIVDFNQFQSDGSTKNIINQENLSERWNAFGWEVIELDGHSYFEIHEGFSSLEFNKKPKLILAKTIKGKGIDFMENDNSWHHGRLTESMYKEALICLSK
tara:strand:- start:16916 stop:17746 length:831 start_codon:yes stop_codon:yes gene_type:complete